MTSIETLCDMCKQSNLLFSNYDIDRDSMRYVNNQIFYYQIMTSIETLCDICKQSNLLFSNYDIDRDSMPYVNNQNKIFHNA